MTRPPPPVDRRDSFDIKPRAKEDADLKVTIRDPGRYVPKHRVILSNGRPARPDHSNE